MDPQMTPAAWLQYLEPLLDEQVAAIQTYQDYYDGKHRLQMATAKFREAFSRYFPPLANNWMQVVVDAPVSRLTVQGFRFNVHDPGSPIAVNGQIPPWELDDDSEAWDIWQANNLDSVSRMLHTDAVKLGVSYVLVQPADPKKPTGEFPIITPEHADQCYVYCDPENRIHRLAAIKRWVDDIDEYAYANVYLPDQIIKWRSADKVKDTSRKINWTRRSDDPGGPNPFGLVPIVALENKPDLKYGGRSDLEQAIPIQDAVNKYCLDMQVSSEFHAFPQRWASGWERAVDDKGREISGREVELYLSASRFIRAEGEQVKFGAFPQGNVEEYLRPIEMYIDHLAAQTQTPLYYLKGKTANVSADSMHAQDQGLVDRCGAKLLSFSDGWEEVMRLAFVAKGDQQRGTARGAEVLWADVESKSLAVLVQAAMVMRTQLQVPIEMCWEMLGWSPQKIRLARDLMGLPPGGGLPPQQSLEMQRLAMTTPGAPGANDPNTHPNNQPGLPSGQAAATVSASLSATRAQLPG